MNNNKYAYFWGCQIPARLPFLEISTRIVLEKVGIYPIELDGFTCCPERSIIKVLDETLWSLIAVNNLSIAGENNVDLITPCTGCFSVLRTAQHEQSINSHQSRIVNDKLGKIGINNGKKGEIFHIIELFHDIAGLPKIKAKLMKNFTGIKVGVHYGCHMTRPNYASGFDDPFEPVKMDKLVELTGAESVAYEFKMQCCGESLNRVDEIEIGLQFARQKLIELKNAGVDVLIVACPACFMQFDNQQSIMKRAGENIDIPVLYCTELIGLAMGFSADDLKLNYHRTDVTPFIEKCSTIPKRVQQIMEYFDMDSLKRCLDCLGCNRDCPLVSSGENYHPDEIIKEILEGRLPDAIRRKEIWFCLECHTCSEYCPQNYSWEKIMEILKYLAIKEDHYPKTMKNAHQLFHEKGRLVEVSRSLRKKVGLSTPPGIDREKWQKIINHLENSI